MTGVVLFVCTGNICRSPIAQALFNAKARRAGEDKQFVARSAGIWALENQPPVGLAITVMAERGLDISGHRGRSILKHDLAEADSVIVMTRSHRHALVSESPEDQDKIHLMSELKDRVFDIADPYGGVLSEYQACAQLLEELIESGYEKIKSWIQSSQHENPF